MRGQAHTLEAFAAALLLLGGVVFALQVTALTPLTASTSSQHIENQQGAMAEGVLSAGVANDSLKPTLLYWSESEGRFHGGSYRSAYVGGGPPTRWGQTLNDTFTESGIAFNVNVYYVDGSGNRQKRELVYRGVASDNAVTATRTVTLRDDDTLYDRSMDETDVTVAGSETYFASADIAPNSAVYNVLVVEVVVWRM
jgi:hypothetical protein